MTDFTKNLYDELLSKLEDLDKSRDLESFSPDQRIELILDALNRLKEKLRSYQFESDDAEIRFFKIIMPRFLSLYIYYFEKFDLESVELTGSSKVKCEYCQRRFDEIDIFFNDNREFLRYYRSGRTDLDKYYFLRNSTGNPGKPDWFATIIDPSVCTVYSLKLAWMLAYPRIERDLQAARTGWARELAGTPDDGNKLVWTDTKAGLVELIYSLKGRGAFNNGKADLQKITKYFEHVFCVQLSNPSSSFQKILYRKKGYTKYLDVLKEEIDKIIDEMDED